MNIDQSYPGIVNPKDISLGKIGADWCSWLRQEIVATQAEVVLVDPLLSFAGIEVGRHMHEGREYGPGVVVYRVA